MTKPGPASIRPSSVESSLLANRAGRSRNPALGVARETMQRNTERAQGDARDMRLVDDVTRVVLAAARLNLSS
jgi:hypothetical protein